MIERNVLFTINRRIFTYTGVTYDISLVHYLLSYFYGIVGKAKVKFTEFHYLVHNVNLNL